MVGFEAGILTTPMGFCKPIPPLPVNFAVFSMHIFLIIFAALVI
jgi:hypothetical protein